MSGALRGTDVELDRAKWRQVASQFQLKIRKLTEFPDEAEASVLA